MDDFQCFIKPRKKMFSYSIIWPLLAPNILLRMQTSILSKTTLTRLVHESASLRAIFSRECSTVRSRWPSSKELQSRPWAAFGGGSRRRWHRVKKGVSLRVPSAPCSRTRWWWATSCSARRGTQWRWVGTPSQDFRVDFPPFNFVNKNLRISFALDL